MSALRVEPLVKRSVKGSALTHGEAEGNETKLTDAINAAFDIIAASLNPDGTLKEGSVLAGAIGKRAVDASNMAFKSSLFAVDTGGVNKIVVAFDPPMEAYEDGTIIFVRVVAEPTGVTTLKVDALDAVQVLKGTAPIEAGDFKKNTICIFGYYGGNWQLAGSIVETSSTDSGSAQSIVFESSDALPGNGLSATFVHGLGVVPESYAAYLVCNSLYGDGRVFATATLTSDNTNVANNDTVTIGNKTYTFKAALTPVEGEVLIGANADASLLNLIRAINHTGTPNTDYKCAAAHTQVSAAAAVTAHAFLITSLNAGTGANAYASTETSAHLSFGGATFAGGVAGYAFGDQIPIGQAVDVGDLPAFSVTSSVANIVVTQNTAAVYVPDPSVAGTTFGIDETKWQVKVVIRQAVSSASMMAPPLTLQVNNPVGGICHGNDLFALISGGLCWIRIDLTTGVAKLTATNAPAHAQPGIGLFFSNAVNAIIYTCIDGLFWFDVAHPETVLQLGTHGNLTTLSPLELDETPAPTYPTPSAPTLYAVEVYKSEYARSMTMHKLTTHTGVTAGNTTIGTVNFHDDGISNIAAFQALEGSGASNATSSLVRYMGYNPVKKRIYLVTEKTGLLHIFKHTAASLNAWWASANYGQLTYEKAIVLAGIPTNDAQFKNERQSVEFDLITGQEKSVVFGRNFLTTGTGSITRSPWVEG